MSYAILLASGAGTRFGSDAPKQLVRLAGRPIFEHALRTFHAHPAIEGIVLVANDQILSEAEELKRRFPALLAIVPGGARRAHSTWQGLCALKGIAAPTAKILVHDGARPLITGDVISRALAALHKFDAVDTVVDATDTIVEVIEGVIDSIPSRNRLRRGQTPQGFHYESICAAFDRFLSAGDTDVTDDCGIYLRYASQDHGPIGVVYGAEANIKITHPSDLLLAEELIRLGAGGAACDIRSARGLVTVILGGNAGIGASLHDRLALVGNRVHVFSRSNGCDVADPHQVAEALGRVMQAEGRIDAIVLTAGVLHTRALLDHSRAEMELMVATNFMGAVHVARESHSYLKQSRGQLVLFSSSSYTRGREFYSIYSATKAAVVNLCQALAEEWRKDGIRVNCIVPSRTATAMRSKNFALEDDLQDLLNPVDVAQEVEQLMRSELTGQIIHIKSHAAGRHTTPVAEPVHL